MAPKFWMASRRLTMTLCRDMAKAPLDRHTVTTMGSISGVSPTATARANMNAPIQSPLVAPLMMKTKGTMTIMKRSMSMVKFLMPLSKSVSTRFSESLAAMPPK